MKFKNSVEILFGVQDHIVVEYKTTLLLLLVRRTCGVHTTEFLSEQQDHVDCPFPEDGVVLHAVHGEWLRMTRTWQDYLFFPPVDTGLLVLHYQLHVFVQDYLFCTTVQLSQHFVFAHHK